jgi:hypothetical protein
VSPRGPLLALALLALGGALRAEEPAPLCRPSVGLRAQVEVVVPGPRLVVRPLGPADELVLRVVACDAAGADAFRYRLELYGLTPGRHDLGRYLQRADGTAAAGLPALPVEVLSLLPPGPAEPAALPPRAPPRLGGYRLLLGVLGAAWVAGLVALWRAGRARRAPAAAAPPPPPPRAAELLRPLVEDALGGRLDVAGQARLEALILKACRDRLDLGALPAREALARLRRDPEAGPVVAALEQWLHAPPGPGGERAGRPALERVLGALAAPGRPA